MRNAFTFIVLNHNNLYIDFCINSIKKYKGKNDEIIIIDDHSTQENYNRLLAHTKDGCIVLQNKEHPHNLCYSRNLGAEQSKNEYLLFLDGDAYFYDDCIEQLRQGLYSENVVCTTAYECVLLGKRAAGKVLKRICPPLVRAYLC